MTDKRVKIQIDASEEIRDRAKAVAYNRKMLFNEFVLQALAGQGDKELTALIKKDLSEKTKPGRPQK